MAAEIQSLTTSKHDVQKRRQSEHDTKVEARVTVNLAREPISVHAVCTTRFLTTGRTPDSRTQQPGTGKTASQAKSTEVVLQRPNRTRSLQTAGKAAAVNDERTKQPERARNQAKTRSDPTESAKAFQHTKQ
ncbi:hypothetical protein PM082_024332 [Marasmius tenuissimus]|nr:hypothetical protein PM082_024332 [Marasmius tenuissimus]